MTCDSNIGPRKSTNNLCHSERGSKRYKSSIESYKKKRISIDSSKILNDPSKINSRSNTKTCGVCGTKGHKRDNCPLLLSKGIPISLVEKDKLASDIFNKEIYQTSKFNEEDKRPIILNVRKASVEAIIIHNRYWIKGDYVLDCTILGKTITDKNNKLIKMTLIRDLLITSKDKRKVVNLLQVIQDESGCVHV